MNELLHVSTMPEIDPNGGLIVLIDGQRGSMYELFLEQIYEKLVFPNPKFMTWERYVELMHDLSWIKEKHILLIVSDYGRFLESGKDSAEFEADYTDDILPYWDKKIKVVGWSKPETKSVSVICCEQPYGEIIQNRALITEIAAVYYAKGHMCSVYGLDVIAGVDISDFWVFTGGDKNRVGFGNHQILISQKTGKIEHWEKSAQELSVLCKHGTKINIE